jgi:hypothetical protein
MITSAEQVFWFNAPGTPRAPDDDLPVLRKTAPNFEVNEDCAREILAYSTGERDGIPSCCEPEQEAEILPALSILCQGYLAVHAEEHGEEDSMESALDQMGWSEDLTLSGLDGRVEESTKPDWWRVFDDENGLLDEAEEEWGDEADGWSTVKDLLIRVIGDRDGEDQDREDANETEPQPLESEKDRELVADAYCKLVERLGGRPCQ